MEIKGKNILIKPLELEDVYDMRKWGYHKNPLLSDYNFPVLNNNEVKRWYEFKTKSFFNKYYGVRKRNKVLIGYLGIKDIKLIRRRSTLGIVLDPDYTNQGYGTEIMEVFLNYYFSDLRMRKMNLEVTKFNKRAYSLYKKIGFLKIDSYLDKFHNNDLDLNNKYYLENKSSFVIKDGKIYNYIYKMELSKERFLDRFSKV